MSSLPIHLLENLLAMNRKATQKDYLITVDRKDYSTPFFIL
jgi:hypothetical protein